MKLGSQTAGMVITCQDQVTPLHLGALNFTILHHDHQCHLDQCDCYNSSMNVMRLQARAVIVQSTPDHAMTIDHEYPYIDI